MPGSVYFLSLCQKKQKKRRKEREEPAGFGAREGTAKLEFLLSYQNLKLSVPVGMALGVEQGILGSNKLSGPEVTEGEATVSFSQRTNGGKLVRNIHFFMYKLEV